MRTEEEVNKIIEDMKNRAKGRYLTQGVSFNKTCPRQMGLLKLALMDSVSFSGLVKEMLALRFEDKPSQYRQPNAFISEFIPEQKPKDFGNFI